MSNHCDICSMNFQNKHDLQGHITGKKHLKRLEGVDASERSIVITQLPNFISAEDLVKFFEQYGSIKWHWFGRRCLTIEYCDRNSATAALNKPVWIKNVKLQIGKKKPRNDTKKPKPQKENSPTENSGIISYDNIKHIFGGTTPFDDQLVNFLNAVGLTDEEIRTKYDPICTELDQIFKVVFPKCKTYKFGSTQTELGFKECDLDIYMDIGEPIHEVKGTPTDSWTMPKILKVMRKLMHRMKFVFSDIISIPKAKTPIIKFRYVRTNVSCDISFKNSLGIHKSNLIKYCISLDSRLRPLMMLIKYWARHFKISGTGRISNYALVLLFIFYLQQPSVNIIPPLVAILNTSQPQLVSGWQVNIDENIALPPITNNYSIPQLLHGFFFFYATFEFKSQIICPIDGMIRTESEFKDIEKLPPCMDRYKECVRENKNLTLNINKVMCIQDPIDLISNTAASTAFSTLNAFVKYCALGAEICATSSKNDYKDLMETLLTTILKLKIKEKKFKTVISANQFPHVMDAIKKDIFTKDDWYFTVFNIVKDIFEKVFKVQVEVLMADVEAKQQKVEALSDVHTEKLQKVMFHCIGSHCIWRKRKAGGIIIDPSLSYLQREALISEQVIANFNNANVLDKINLDFICTFEKHDTLKVSLTISNENCDDHIFQEFVSFAKCKIDCIIRKTLMSMQFDKRC